MADVISIPDTSILSDGVVYYHVSLKLPLRSFTITKRYSEFDELVNQLSSDLGINTSDFPYQLPPKSSIFTSSRNENVINDRKEKLSIFLNSLIRDRDLQNNSFVHNFLQLPLNFKFNDQIFRTSSNGNANNERDLIIDDKSISHINQFKWLELLRLFKYTINEYSKNYDDSINSKIATRDKVNKLIKPNLSKLRLSLSKLIQNNSISNNECQRRSLLLREVENDLSNLQDKLLSHNSVIGNPRNIPQETNDTISLNNNDLLQQQQQVHKNQDQEVEQLRKIIARQRQLGESINNEVSEQNSMLDSFADQVDFSSDKIRMARKKARGIL
ncbi:hypothetical protein HYPBUDRAFT_108721 [Hyphopichia burtonii NRRL Y-1933]|uniref:Phox-like protein n=1 Tax=Hyphopichia burtonii NRRL Y-1933 TaxID=984485 RepID=A0A1E4RKR5_9ASCO|nr:hypothetical protein HYPBUDRAFT_108721 [Hyphopichia burtonii NRRL Y-1933]ODV67859.1 hypothetical protein HYPBUDRAFT_108721 [Hyphopichia burtonii NRRL Y-1933]